jgi:hypothetical protein
LYLDCLAAAGAATLSGSWARLYINNEPYGLFLMIDDSTTSTIDNLLHGGNHQYEFTGPTYKGNALNPQVEGNLVYQGDNPESYNDTMYELEDKGANGKLINKTNEKEALIGFIRQLSTIDPKLITDEANQGEFPKLLDPKHTMIHLALNFLSGSWDGVWLQASNYYLNQDLQSNQWALISYDFDETFGIGAEKHLISTPYTNYSRPGSQRPLIDVFLNSPYYKAEFEKVLQTIVKRFFKASVINPRLEAWTQMLREEVEWDLSITPKSPGIQTQWTLWNFEANMNTTDGLNFGVAEWFNTRSTSLQQQLNFNDADDLPALGPYEGGSQWDPSNYHKKTVNDKKSNDDSQSSDSSSNAISKSTISTAVLLFSTVSLMFLL